MHDSPLISPENKDRNAQTFADLPKVALGVAVEAAGREPGQAAAETARALADDHVVYAELAFNPADFAAPDRAVADALEGLAQVDGIETRLLVVTDGAEPVDAAAWAGTARVVGVELAPQSAAVVDALARQLRKAYLPLAVRVGQDFEVLEAAAHAGAQRLVGPDCVVDDFGASLEGIEPGRASAWLRDRRTPHVFAPPAQTGEELGDHPLPLLQQLGFACAVAPLPGATLTQHFTALAETFGYGLEEFFDLTVTAVEGAFCSQEERTRLLEEKILPAYQALSDADFAEDHLHDDEDPAPQE